MIYNALGWRMAERMQQAELLPGDSLDIAFTLDHNDHPEFGGLELSLRDFNIPEKIHGSLSQRPPRPIADGIPAKRS